MIYKFKAKLIQVDNMDAAYIEIPFDVEKEFGILTLDKKIKEALQKSKLNIKKQIDEIKRQKAAENVYGKQFGDIYFLNKQI